MKKVLFILVGLIAVLSFGCAPTIPQKVVYNFGEKCRLDPSLRYQLVYNVETEKYSDQKTAFLTYKEIAELVKDKMCFVERTIKPPKPKPAPPEPKQPPRYREPREPGGHGRMY